MLVFKAEEPGTERLIKSIQFFFRSRNEITWIFYDWSLLFVFNDCKVAVGSQLPRRINRRMASYVTVDTTQKTDKKTSQCIHVIKLLPFLIYNTTNIQLLSYFRHLKFFMCNQENLTIISFVYRIRVIT
jgi:hypothetical protein